MLWSTNYTTCWFCSEATLQLSITGCRTEWETHTWVRQLPWPRPGLWGRGQLEGMNRGWRRNTSASGGHRGGDQVHHLLHSFPLVTFNTQIIPDRHSLLTAIGCLRKQCFIFSYCSALAYGLIIMSKNKSSIRSFHFVSIQCVSSTALTLQQV